MSDARPVRWGIIATGGISATMVSELGLTPDCEVVAVGSRSLATAERFAVSHSIPRAYGSYEELIADTDVDVVYVGATHDAHYPVARAALEAGRPVLCEKPLTIDADQAVELVDLARRRGVFFMEAMWMWCQPGFLQLMDVLRAGVVGEVRQVIAQLGFYRPYDPTSRIFDVGTAGGALLDIGPYPLMAAQALFGPPSEVRAVGHLAHGIDFTTALVCSWPDGKTALLNCTIETVSTQSLVYAGTGGWVEVQPPFHHVTSWTVHRPGQEPEVAEAPLEGRGYVHMLREVVRCLRAGLSESPLVPLDATLAEMHIFDEARRQIGLTYPESTFR